MTDFIFILQRLKDNGKSTTGEIYLPGITLVSMEDTGRDKNHDGDLSDEGEEKVWGVTRIPCGMYEIKLRTDGKMHVNYKRKFSFHRGMLELQNVPYFKYIYIHILNKAEESHGCIGPGIRKADDDFILDSTVAYVRLYAHVIAELDLGRRVFIDIKDEPNVLQT